MKSKSKIRFYIRTKDGLRRVPISAIDNKKVYLQMANAGDIAYLQVIFLPDERRYNVRAGIARADEVWVLDFAPDTNLFRMRINACLRLDWVS